MDPQDCDRLARLAEQVQRPWPPAWKPEAPGDTIAGRLDRVSQGPDRYSDRLVDVLNIVTIDGSTVAVWLSNKALAQQVAQAAPRVGDLVAVTFVENRVSAGGNKYKAYRVAVDKGDDGTDWAGIADRAESLEEEPW